MLEGPRTLSNTLTLPISTWKNDSIGNSQQLQLRLMQVLGRTEKQLIFCGLSCKLEKASNKLLSELYRHDFASRASFRALADFGETPPEAWQISFRFSSTSLKHWGLFAIFTPNLHYLEP